MSEANIRLQRLMKQFAALGYAMTGFGPKHPDMPNTELQAEVDDFLVKTPFLRRDQGYVDFLEMYAGGATAIWPGPDFRLEIVIYGFTAVTEYLPDPVNGQLIEFDRYFRFAEVQVRPEPDEAIHMHFAWDINQQRGGVYRQTQYSIIKYNVVPYEWYCETFLDWLEALVAKKGVLYD